MLAEIRSGYTQLSDGTVAPARAGRTGAIVTTDGTGRYYEATSRGNVFTLSLNATTSTVAAGNIINAAAAASTQFAVWNPIGSGKNLSLLKFAVGITTAGGTAPTGGLFHSYSNQVPSIATSLAGATTGGLSCNNVGLAAASVARAVTAVGAGTALTGGGALSILSVADFNITNAYVMAVTSAFVYKTVEYIDGGIVLPPGTMYVPTWASAGVTFYTSYSLTWEEIPV